MFTFDVSLHGKSQLKVEKKQDFVLRCALSEV